MEFSFDKEKNKEKIEIFRAFAISFRVAYFFIRSGMYYKITAKLIKMFIITNIIALFDKMEEKYSPET